MEETQSLIRACKIFASLDKITKQELSTQLVKLTLKKNEVVFYQGDPSHDIYLVQSGKLIAEILTTEGITKLVTYVEPKETIGELGTLSNEPRNFTVKALEDSIIYRLPGRFFIHLCNKYPSVLFDSFHPLIKRSQQVLRLFSAEKRRKHIALVPANKSVSLKRFSEKLAELVANHPNVILISDFDSEFKQPHINFATLEEHIDKIDEIKKPRHTIIYLVNAYDSVLSKIAFRYAEVCYVVGDSSGHPHLDEYLLKKLNQRQSHNKIAPELILLHPEGTLRPKNTPSWLNLTSFALHHHIRIQAKKDYARLIRYFRGKPIALVLSGGGTRGWSHLGVIKAILESKIPIDAVGGTSAGAIVAACYAYNQSYEDAYEKFSELIENSLGSVTWRNWTWPAISLYSGKKLTHAQQRAFGDAKIEDLWIPYFCVSTNLATNSEAVHRDGLVWEKIRCSSSVPGLVPPMVMNGEMYFDGALLNNFPVDIMRKLLGKRAKIIGAQLVGDYKDEKKYNFPPSLGFVPALLTDLKFGFNNYHIPDFVDTVFRAILVGSLSKASQNSLLANVLISLNLNKFGLLHSTPKQAKQLIEIGYKTALEQLCQFKT